MRGQFVTEFDIKSKKLRSHLFCGLLQLRQENRVEILNIARTAACCNQCISCGIRLAEKCRTIRKGHSPTFGFEMSKKTRITDTAVNTVHNKYTTPFHLIRFLKNPETSSINYGIICITATDTSATVDVAEAQGRLGRILG